MKDVSLIYPSIERANDTPLSRPFSLACYLHIIAIFYPIMHYKERSLLNVTARLWRETCPALQIKAQNRVFRHFVISELNRVMAQCLRQNYFRNKSLCTSFVCLISLSESFAGPLQSCASFKLLFWTENRIQNCNLQN